MSTRSPDITVGLVGCGSMGRGIAFQVGATPGMRMAWVADRDPSAAEAVAALAGCPATTDASRMLAERPVDVMVEATNSIGAAAEYCLQAFETGAHVVLMNAEVDLALGPLLHREAVSRGLTLTSDAGDQHGVLASLITEADRMGFEVVQAGNIKGFLDRRATPTSLLGEAAKRRLSPSQCCAYTDGTKLHIEMAVLANGFGYLPPDGGMTGPRAASVHDALGLFDFDAYAGIPRVDYLLGAEPNGGVYLVVQPKPTLPDEQRFYLGYYKLGAGPRYVLYRPYHLCHLETPKAIFAAAEGRPILAPGHGSTLLGGRKSPAVPTCDVFARAKRDLRAGETMAHAIGSDACYGTIDRRDAAGIPIVLLEAPSVLRHDVPRDAPITIDDLELPDVALTRHWRRQREWLVATGSSFRG
jgi:predicted homoserine dehydrogenase-like protein